MIKYILKRLLNMIPVIFIISILIFATVRSMPGDPVNAYLGMGSKVTPEQKEVIREQLGLNGSMPEQYIRWAGRLVQGDLGESIKYKKPVTELIGEYIWNTFLLNVISLILAVLISIPIGIKQATKKYSKFDNFWTVFSLFGISVPTFFFGLVLVFFLSLQLGLLPMNGMRDPIQAAFGYPNIFANIADVASHMVIPVIVLAFGSFSSLSRYVRNAMIDVINQDYIRTARAKGLKEKVVIYRHAFKNALIPLVTLLGSYIPSLFSGAMILETVFLWPGLGWILIEAINSRDLSVTTAVLLFSAVLMLLGNLLSDVLYSVVDPRIKTE
ncbi:MULTISPECIES: ABC transporter permease [unclassified Breznakia]|uniref:ABC transporter permease n=1 Tax=unclassified Breznakia TaxID=2623764 RepID=UPI002475DAF4|nr:MULTISPECIES: ABC transporter permease [unclassified Breznakia]MDH6367580.1 peptide/nickel transport system permease protein [Breznakia sp. PH1-1]MDH6404700.1 peptide/nickel transport system permease protein [Breznakia sp. PF1-11]MDH6412410.1 peptide/nickel transport system permease protein [Breznakia sp. PFB1-11]MDH6414775.1 peptide/nickel transport system permease protein [Breznakia sp. PFB1-14]MDH6417081.1 peptide/nickel transport system permease protein [Breznakia sp. PFB1-4]